VPFKKDEIKKKMHQMLL